MKGKHMLFAALFAVLLIVGGEPDAARAEETPSGDAVECGSFYELYTLLLHGDGTDIVLTNDIEWE